MHNNLDGPIPHSMCEPTWGEVYLSGNNFTCPHPTCIKADYASYDKCPGPGLADSAEQLTVAPCVDQARGRSDGKCCPSCAQFCPGHCGDHDCSCNAGDFYLGFSCEADKDCPGSYCMKDPSKKPPYQCH